ncbi:WW domain binding protein 11-domain-containing protein [Podospora australis]|uniref:WW domain binding protein 11-domain-containing protein n=1 Tax=Podospora australis TaxID=1536484 RepID=A0AAN6WSS2_9PEZI|nr:WW domain binding protein 11-domain-containing protein [Podospora australis]
MAKEKGYNPVQAQRKADKQKEIKKNKSQQQAKRNEKLAQRNPDRIQRQIDDLKALKEQGRISAVEEQSLEALEKDLKAVKKAREALGDKAPTLGHGGHARPGQRSDGVLGKRRRDADDESSDDSDVPADVQSIPMPRDTPPPIPKEVLDEWYAKRRAKRNANANHEPLAERSDRPQDRQQSAKPKAPMVEAKTVYEAKPVVRDLRKEAVSAFVPTTVKLKLEKAKGQGGLLEPEELDQLERAGYIRTSDTHQQQFASAHPVASHGASGSVPRRVTMEEVQEEEDSKA